MAAAGRIVDGETVKVTNNPWAISAHQTAAALGLEYVHLVNDFAALLQQMTELAHRRLVRRRLAPQIDAHEPAHRG